MLRDLFIWLALNKTYRVHWTSEIQVEWTRNLLQNRPDISRAALERTQNLMNKALPDALLEFVPALDISLPDPNDTHVLEAAIHANATHIVTNNLRDFPNSSLEEFGIVALSPDDFVMCLIESTPELVLQAIQMQLANLKRPVLSLEQPLLEFEAQGLTQVVLWLQEYSKLSKNI